LERLGDIDAREQWLGIVSSTLKRDIKGEMWMREWEGEEEDKGGEVRGLWVAVSLYF